MPDPQASIRATFHDRERFIVWADYRSFAIMEEAPLHEEETPLHETVVANEAEVATTVASPPKPAPNRGAFLGVATGATAMVCVGGSVAVSSVLAGAPVFTAEAVRYGLACLILVALAKITGRPLTRPRGGEWLWLAGIAVTGLVLFNLALV